MTIVAAVSRNWGIGYGGELLFSIPADMRFFRETTENGALIMGRKTFESLPGGAPLKNRLNIVLSRRTDFEAAGAVAVRSAGEALDAVRGFERGRVFVIGGEEVYRLMLPYCRLAYITRVDAEPPADRFLPDLSETPGWALTGALARGTFENLAYSIEVYERISQEECFLTRENAI